MKILINLLLILTFFISSSYGFITKKPSDVFSYGMLLKQKIEYLRKKEGVTSKFPTVPVQHNKYPRHVIQKAFEILSKINLYRVSKGYGEIFIPPYPTREITPSDVYEMVKRLDAEVTPFIKDRKFLSSLKLIKYKNKTPNDVYRLLWSISLALDDLLGIYGYTPTDVYELTLKLLDNVKFLRSTQNIYEIVEKPKKKQKLYPNHALYESYKLTQTIRNAEKNLWIKNPTEVPKKPLRVITPTDVYDSVQYNLAEIQRIKYRLGVERYFKTKNINEPKTTSDVVQNIQYAIKLFPKFDLKKKLIQYPTTSLEKTPNHVYAVTQEILKKIDILKNLKGIKQPPKIPPYIYGLKPIHAYQKAIEATEKAIRLKVQMGFYPSQVPSPPLRPITPNEVYEAVIRLDGIITILLKKEGYKTEEYIYKINKKIPTNKKPSDVYNNLWKISNNLDLLLASEYTPKETYALSKEIMRKVIMFLKQLKIKKSIINRVLNENIDVENKIPADVFRLTLEVFNTIKQIKYRMNMGETNILIPQEKNVTPNTVYNALRIVNAAINEIIVYKKIYIPDLLYNPEPDKIRRTPTDVYRNIMKIYNLLNLLYNEKNYEK